MNIKDYIMLDENEKPLDRIVSDGGFASIFRSICCIGDSLSSGEFEHLRKDGGRDYIDMFEYSWGQCIARDCGSKVYNFSRGGMTAKEYIESFAENNGFWNKDKACSAYIIALGVNDMFGFRQELGSTSDIDIDNYENNEKNFAGYYAAIVQRLKKISPDAKFFFVTMPEEGDENDEIREAHSRLLYDLADLLGNSYVIDLYKYAPVYDDSFKKRFYMYGHMNPAGYVLTSKMIESYIDYIIRHNASDFKQVGFIGTDYYDTDLDN